MNRDGFTGLPYSGAYGYCESHAGNGGRALAATDWQAIDAQSDGDIARNVAHDLDAPPMLTGGETAAAIVRTVRKRVGLSQVDFAARFHVPVGTLRDWEQNRRQPDAPALAYLRVIAREPDMVARALVVA
jgi:putative transcriptional regulator